MCNFALRSKPYGLHSRRFAAITGWWRPAIASAISRKDHLRISRSNDDYLLLSLCLAISRFHSVSEDSNQPRSQLGIRSRDRAEVSPTGITWRNFYFRLYRGTIRTAQVLDFLNHLLSHLPSKLLVIWDRLPQHRARLVREFVAAQSGRLLTEYLPSYAPELNPVKYLWDYWKHHALPNFCPDDLTELGYFGRLARRRMRRRPALVRSFWKQANLSL